MAFFSDPRYFGIGELASLLQNKLVIVQVTPGYDFAQKRTYFETFSALLCPDGRVLSTNENCFSLSPTKSPIFFTVPTFQPGAQAVCLYFVVGLY